MTEIHRTFEIPDDRNLTDRVVSIVQQCWASMDPIEYRDRREVADLGENWREIHYYREADATVIEWPSGCELARVATADLIANLPPEAAS